MHSTPKALSVSPWGIFILMALMFGGGMYLFANSGGFSPSIFDTNRVSWSGAGAGPAAVPDPMVVGKKVFTQVCSVCHQSTGLGVPGQFPPLVGSEWVLGTGWQGDNHIVKIVLNGLQGVVNVNGANYNNAMAPWGTVLKDEQIAAVLTYVRNEWGNSAPPISRDFVAQIRKETADRKDPWTQKELQAIPRVVGSATAPTAGAK